MENLESLDIQYEDYLNSHINGVQKGYNWFKKNCPNIIDDILDAEDIDIISLDNQFQNHDYSKYSISEWEPYRNYFYADKDKYKKDFDKAWLDHQHYNPHHWQHWVLVNDDEGTIGLEIPHRYLLEMVCDWWSFSWNKDDLKEIFNWYDEHKDSIIMDNNSRKFLEDLLDEIKEKC